MNSCSSIGIEGLVQDDRERFPAGVPMPSCSFTKSGFAAMEAGSRSAAVRRVQYAIGAVGVKASVGLLCGRTSRARQVKSGY